MLRTLFYFLNIYTLLHVPFICILLKFQMKVKSMEIRSEKSIKMKSSLSYNLPLNPFFILNLSSSSSCYFSLFLQHILSQVNKTCCESLNLYIMTKRRRKRRKKKKISDTKGLMVWHGEFKFSDRLLAFQ